MTKEEYQDFVLRYKGCGVCFPMYHTLSRFEKMWFTAVQKDVAKLEKENEELKEINEGYCRNRDRLISMGFPTFKDCKEYAEHLTKAREIILKLYNAGRDVLMCREEEKAYDNLSEAISDKSIEKFLQEVSK